MKRYRVFLFVMTSVLLIVLVFSYLWLTRLNTVAVFAEQPAQVTVDKPDLALKTVEHVVEPGNTLWEIARKYRPGEDPRKVIYEIMLENGMDDTRIWPGDVLLVPGVRFEFKRGSVCTEE